MESYLFLYVRKLIDFVQFLSWILQFKNIGNCLSSSHIFSRTFQVRFCVSSAATIYTRCIFIWLYYIIEFLSIKKYLVNIERRWSVLCDIFLLHFISCRIYLRLSVCEKFMVWKIRRHSNDKLKYITYIFKCCIARNIYLSI